MSVSINKIVMLEERINKMLDVVKQLQGSNTKLADEKSQLQKELAEKTEKLESIEQNYNNIKKEYDTINSSQEEIKEKIENMLDNLEEIADDTGSPQSEEAVNNPLTKKENEPPGTGDEMIHPPIKVEGRPPIKSPQQVRDQEIEGGEPAEETETTTGGASGYINEEMEEITKKTEGEGEENKIFDDSGTEEGEIKKDDDENFNLGEGW